MISYGEHRDYWDHREFSAFNKEFAQSTNLCLANCIAWVRVGDENHDGSVTVICNGQEDGEKRCEVGQEHAGEKWTDVMGWHQGEVTIEEGE